MLTSTASPPLTEQISCSAKEDVAFRRESHLLSGAVKERRPELCLEQTNLLRKRRLGHSEPFGRAAEMEFLGDGDEVSHLTEFHAVLIPFAARCCHETLGSSARRRQKIC